MNRASYSSALVSPTIAHGPNDFLAEDTQAEHGTASHRDESYNFSVPPEVALNNSAPSFNLTAENNGTCKFPSCLSWFINFDPPIHAVTIGVQDTNGSVSPQGFDHSAIFRFISTLGALSAVRNVRYPTTGAQLHRDNALLLLHPVSVPIQGRMNQEHAQLGLFILETSPLTQEDYNLYNQTVANVLNL